MSKPIKRAKFLEFFTNRAPCRIGMEACWGARRWARQLQRPGYEVSLLPGQFVKAFNIRNKNDAADAQAMLALHRMREQLVKFRTLQINGLRGLLAEYGEVMNRRRARIDKEMPEILARLSEHLPAALIETLREQFVEIGRLDERIAMIERRLNEWKKSIQQSKRSARFPASGG